MQREEVLIRIVSPWFVAGVVWKDNRVIRAAPIVKYMVGWSTEQVAAHISKRGWDSHVCTHETEVT